MTTLDVTQGKILDQAILSNRLAMWRFQMRKIVFTNGCFDVLHRGHIEYLSKARDLGDMLIIGLNTDDSVKRIKGEGRPVQDQASRALILASLRFVEAVILFDEDTPYDLISMIKPDVLVKGGDYSEETIVGADIVKENGGEVVTIPLVEGYSTSGLIKVLGS
ncbi:MAG: D-glycero-beta-D-manno-heptose 1-phosphate adenylyltransferase [Bacteroidales bacterium]|nr:D-glycero-beta-D-manno-heptose 1-phosphate adenylyltransferase [Bacteroidales bacterium]